MSDFSESDMLARVEDIRAVPRTSRDAQDADELLAITDHFVAECAALRADNERLRGWLLWVAAFTDGPDFGDEETFPSEMVAALSVLNSAARRALEGHALPTTRFTSAYGDRLSFEERAIARSVFACDNTDEGRDTEEASRGE